MIDIHVEEGHKFYFGTIDWLGNTKYPSDVLENVLRIRKGDVYDGQLLQERLFFDPNGNDVSSLYLDNGYLFFQLNPVEVRVENDSIDYEMRISEGRQATINEVSVSGNDRTNDHVVMRELRTVQELYLEDPTCNGPIGNLHSWASSIPGFGCEHPAQSTERNSGYRIQGGGKVHQPAGASGRLGRRTRGWHHWFELQQLLCTQHLEQEGVAAASVGGDGQTISLRAQSNGSFFQSYSVSFTEPWLGGKKPNSLTLSVFHNVQTNGLPKGDANRQALQITSISAGLGRRLKWPDDYFTLYTALEYQIFNLQKYQTGFLAFNDGRANSLNLKFVLGRNNTDVPIFPTKGSNFSLALEVTPPFTLMNGQDLRGADDSEKYRWIEYHKWKFSGSWFSQIAKNFVLRTHMEFGVLGFFNPDIGLPPFERFFVGGDGLQNFVIDGREIIGLRGYPNNSLSGSNGDPLYTKFIFEFRYLISPNPQAQIFALAFAEGGNSYRQFEEFNPFLIKRSAGIGIRIFMPMFNLLGIDFGHGFDPIPGAATPSGWQTHFIIGQQF